MDRLNRFSAAEDWIGEMEDKPEEITHNVAQKDKKVENRSCERWRIQRRVPTRIKKNQTKAIFAEKGWSIFQNQRFTFLDSGNTINLHLDKDTMDVRNSDEPT